MDLIEYQKLRVKTLTEAVAQECPYYSRDWEELRELLDKEQLILWIMENPS